MNKKYILMFITGFLSCLLLFIIFTKINIVKLNNLFPVENKSIAEERSSEIIFSIEKDYEDNKNKTIDISKLKQDYHKYDLEINTNNIKNLENMNENYPKTDYQIIINGVRMEKEDIHSIQINNGTYINIKEMQRALNHLNVVVSDEDKVLNIYESSGLGIIDYNGQQYIEYSDIMERYCVSPPILPYVTLLDYREIIDSKNNRGIVRFSRDMRDFLDDKYYPSLLVKKEEIIEQLPLILKSICTNELYIKEFPEAIYDKLEHPLQ